MPRYVDFFCYNPNPFTYWNHKQCTYLYMYIFVQIMKYGRKCSLCNWKFPPLRYSSTTKNYFLLWRTVMTVRRGLSLLCNRGHRNRINKHVGFSRKCNKQYIHIWHNDSVYHINTEPKPEYYQIKVQNRKIKAIPNRTIITKPSS